MNVKCSRYSFGYWGNMIVVVFSMVSTTGWNAVNSISGASILSALSDGKFPTWAGVIVMCTSVWLICSLGITWVHRLGTFMWIPTTIIWCVTAGTGASHFTGASQDKLHGANKAGAVLSYIAIIFSFSVSWINCAADYNVRMPVNTPRWKIFSATYIGIFVPSVLVHSLGAALYTGTMTNPEWKTAYSHEKIGGLVKMALEPAGGFGKFLMALAGLSAIPVSPAPLFFFFFFFCCKLLHLHLEQSLITSRVPFPTTIHSPCMPRTLGHGLFASHG